MSIPQMTVLAFALWTIGVPLGAIGVYRWSRIFSGAQPIHAFRSDVVEGADWYRRAMRAHANCVENLPVLAVLVWLATVLGVEGPALDLSCGIIAAGRVGQTVTHIGWVESQRSVSIRFSFFLAQLLCMVAISALILVRAAA